MPSENRFLAFRLYGQMRWPPVVGIAQDGQPVAGAVEIFYVWDDHIKRYAACLRWLAKSLVPADANQPWPVSATPLAAIRNVYALTQNELGHAFDAAIDGELVLRFDAQAIGTSEKVKLRFEGLSALEQYDLPLTTSPAPPGIPAQLRIPLLGKYAIGTQNDSSALQIGQPSHPKLRLDLALALPAPLNERQRTNKVALLAFSALYAPTLAKLPSKIGPMTYDTLTYGPPGADLRLTPQPGALGAFSFAMGGADNTEYAVPRANHDDDAGEAARVAAWASEETILKAVLPTLGVRFAAKRKADLNQRFNEDGEFEVASRLIRMPSIALLARKLGNASGFMLRQCYAIRTEAGAESSIDEAQSDIRVRAGHFQLRAPNGADRWLTLGRTLYVVIDTAGIVADVWATEHRLSISARIGWAERLSALGDSGDMLGAAPSMSVGAGVVELLAATVPAMRLARVDLAHLSPLQSQSMLPELKLDTGSNKAMHFGAFLTLAPVTLDSVGAYMIGPGAGARLASLRVSLQTDDVFADPANAREHNRVRMRASWPAFHHRVHGELPACRIELAHDMDALLQRDSGARETKMIWFAIEGMTQAGSELPVEGRLGGMAFEQDLARLLAPGASRLHVGARTLMAPDAAGNRPLNSAELELTLGFQISSVKPLGVDIPADERRNYNAALLLHEDLEPDDAASDRYLLQIREIMGAGERWRLTAELYDNAAGQPDVKTVMFSEQPFAVQRFWSTPLGALGDAGNAVAANYDSDSGLWELRRKQRSYHYVLPPQVAGESMDKPRRLELHDAPGMPGPDGFISPVPPAAANVVQGLRRYPVEFRLTPPAELWIDPSDVERNYFAPPWASARIFRQKSDLGRGAALTALRAEFVYGLPVSVLPSAERGPARRARVAEIDALAGLPQVGGSAERGRWQMLMQVMARRPERLEVWADDPNSTVAFAPARFTDSARLALRSTALHRPPVPAADPDSDPIAPLWPRERAPGAPRLHPHGLSGGALWPIESHNVLNMLLDAPVADGGSLEQVALSPHGGDAEQDAKFCNRIVSIITSTRAGFVQRQKVEVIGRIGVFWHRAKHVVIYERSANPSAQFTPEHGIGTRTRRPVLRKISEYVEILQPERRYPDAEGARANSCGFLRGLRFNSLIIAVDSAWAEDIGQIGWKVPLWNRHAARQRPQVYPRPDIAFVTAAEGPQSAAETAQECLDPDNLFFFADTSGMADERTDLWKARVGIDYTNLPAPCHDWPVKRSAATSEASSTACPPRVPPGFARFTWALGPSSQRSTINAGRANEPMYAALESITFMRSLGTTSVEGVHDAIHIHHAVKKITPLFPGAWVKGEPLPAEAGDELVTLSQALAAAGKMLNNGYPQNDVEREAARAVFTELRQATVATVGNAQLATRVQAISDDCKGAFAGLNDVLGAAENNLPSYCKSLGANLTASLGAKRLSMVQEVRAWQAEAQEAIKRGRLDLAFTDADQLHSYLKTELADLLEPVFSNTAVEVGKLRRGIETSHATLATARGEIGARCQAELQKLHALRAAFDLEKPWSQARTEQFKQRLDEAFQRLQSGIIGALDDGRRRLATELDDFSQKMGTAAARALDALESGQATLDSWSSITAGLHAQVAALRDQIRLKQADFDAQRQQAFKALEDARDAHPEHAGKIDAIIDQIEKVAALLPQAEDGLAKLNAALQNKEIAITGEARKNAADLSALVNAAASALDRILSALDADLQSVETVLLEAVRAGLQQLRLPVDVAQQRLLADMACRGAWIDAVIGAAATAFESRMAACSKQLDEAARSVDEVSRHSLAMVQDAETALEPKQLGAAIIAKLMADERVEHLRQEAGAALSGLEDIALWRAAAIPALERLADEFVAQLEKPFDLGADYLHKLTDLCVALGGGIGHVREQLIGVAKDILQPLEGKLNACKAEVLDQLEAALSDPQRYIALVKAFDGIDRDVRVIGTDLASTAQKAQAYGERVVDAIGQIGAGGLAGAPSNILKAFAAAGDAPHMPNLDFAKERLAYYYGALNDVIDTTPVEAWFGRLSEGLGSMGLNAPCDRIGDWFQTMDLSNCDIGKVIDKFAGCELGKLIKGQKFSDGLGEAIRITHEFDQKHARAWVQIDVDVPINGSNPLFSVGPFSLNMVDARLLGKVRLEAAADSDKVEQTGSASISTGFDAVVGGQSMVTLNNVVVRYDKSGSLQVDFDPKNIKLNPTFQFIQNTLQSIVGDTIGGLKIVKRDGIPVGVEHLFSIPPMSLMFGTSGVQNLQISNQFQLLAYPDFMIANRFSLARPNRPFIFSVFIIGGTGWLTVDCEYRPFKDELLVVVEAGAGGSASLGFAFAGCTGSIAISISVALTYRKLIGQPGGGLTVSLVVLIVGVIDVLCVANAELSLLLRLSYMPNGDIDASGTFSLTIRISRFFEVSADGEARYAMRGGQSQSSSDSTSSYKVKDENLNKAQNIIEAQRG